MRRQAIDYLIYSLIGIALALIYYLTKIPSDPKASDYLKILSDSALIPGIILLCIYILISINKEGLFDGLTYSAKYVTSKFIPTKRTYENESYYDYKQAKAEKRKEIHLECLIVSIAFICLSIIFYLIYKVN